MDRIILPDDVVERGGFDVKVTFPDEERRPPVIVKFVRRNWAVVTFADRLSRVRHFSIQIHTHSNLQLNRHSTYTYAKV